MRNRNVKIQVWLSKKEAENLQKKARRSHISVALIFAILSMILCRRMRRPQTIMPWHSSFTVLVII